MKKMTKNHEYARRCGECSKFLRICKILYHNSDNGFCREMNETTDEWYSPCDEHSKCRIPYFLRNILHLRIFLREFFKNLRHYLNFSIERLIYSLINFSLNTRGKITQANLRKKYNSIKVWCIICKDYEFHEIFIKRKNNWRKNYQNSRKNTNEKRIFSGKLKEKMNFQFEADVKCKICSQKELYSYKTCWLTNLSEFFIPTEEYPCIYCKKPTKLKNFHMCSECEECQKFGYSICEKCEFGEKRSTPPSTAAPIPHGMEWDDLDRVQYTGTKWIECTKRHHSAWHVSPPERKKCFNPKDQNK